MSAAGIEWAAVLLFAILFAGALGAEIFWLTKKGWTTAGKAAAFVILTNLVSFSIGSFLVFALGLVAFMMVMGPAGRGSDTPESAYIAIMIAGLIVPLLIFIGFKRLMLGAFKIKTGRPAWLYSIAVGVLFLIIVIIPPPLLFYIAASLWK